LVDVLLTHSYHLPYDQKQLRKMQPYMPLGTLYASAALRAHGISVAVFDTMLTDPERFESALNEHRPRIVAIYEDDFNFLSKMCLTRMRDVAFDIAASAKQAGATVISHGSDATDHPELFLQRGIDYILRGEAEETLVALCSSLLDSRPLGEIDGLVSRTLTGRASYSTQRLSRNSTWINLPEASRDLIDLTPYRKAWIKAHGYFSVNMVASRGCPYGCNWCAKPISGNKFQLRPATVVAQEMRRLKVEVGAEHIWFGDDVFALHQGWIQQFSAEVVKRDAALPFKIQSRADLMSDATVAALKSAGCAEVWMGVESGSQKILDAMNKGLKLSSVFTARRRLEEAGIRACYFLQLGYPGETWEDLQKTIALVRDTSPNDIGVSFSYPLPGTTFFERVKAELGQKRNWADSDDLCIMFNAAYTSDFYRAVRDALHAEVDLRTGSSGYSQTAFRALDEIWRKVYALEPVSRNAAPTDLPVSSSITRENAMRGLFPVSHLLATKEV
jgi:anaerobic magnesium-protoporphyrin IX monomethyl ester cyclase